MTKVYHLGWMQDRKVFTEESIGDLLEGKVEGEDFHVHELGSHTIDEKIPEYVGWTPHYLFDESGFTKEYHVDLIQIGEEVDDFVDGVSLVGPGKVVSISSEELTRGRNLAGTQELYDQQRLRLEVAFRDLNSRGVEFIVFRTYRRFPTVWDSVYLYSVGDFQDKS